MRTARRRHGAARGFTLLETLFATLLISLILAGVMDLFLTASKITVRSNAITATGLSSANAVQQILKDTREAQALSLPDDAAFQPLAGFTATGTNYKTTLNGQTVLTALELNVPSVQTRSVLDSGGSTVALDGSSPSKTLYDRGKWDKATGDYILFYRGNADQSPNPAGGRFLWRYQRSINAATIVCRNIAVRAADAVQFIQPSGAATQVAVKVVSGEYSLIHGQQTNEESDGSTTSALTGKCVLMRDFGNANPSQNTDTCNHAFQHS